MNETLEQKPGVAVEGARMLEGDKRFAVTKPLSPVLDGVMVDGGPTYLTINAVGSDGKELYVAAFTRQMAQELVEHFTEYLNDLDDEERKE